jgi:hypothetical protein
MKFYLADTDLAQLAKEIRRAFADSPPVGYLPGKTVFRDFVMTKLQCSMLEAEEIVDTMALRGFLRYQGATSSQIDGLLPWDIETTPNPT